MKIMKKRTIMKLSRTILSAVLSVALLAASGAELPAVYAAEAVEGPGSVQDDSAAATDGSGQTEENKTSQNGDSMAGNDVSGENKEDAGTGNDASGENKEDSGAENSGSQTGDGTDHAGSAPDGNTEDGTGAGDRTDQNPSEDSTSDKEAGEDTGTGEPETPEEEPEEETANPEGTDTDKTDADEAEPGDTDMDETDTGVTDTKDTEETVSENDLDEREEAAEEDSAEFSDMPSGYGLTSLQKELKAGMAADLRSFNEDEEGETFAEGEVITFAGSEEEAELIAQAYRAEIVSFDMGVLALKLRPENTVRSALEAAADTDNNLPPVWPNYHRELFGEIAADTENDSPLLAAYEQALNAMGGYDDPYLKPSSSMYQWFHTTIGSPYAWNAGYKGAGIKVGVIDSGVDANADLDANVFGKKDFCDGTEDAADYIGHGTHVAGIIAALGNGEKGVGVAPQAQIFNARVYGKDSSKSGYDATVIAAINYLIGEENNATGREVSNTSARVDIINMSLGGPGSSSAFQTVIDKAYQKGVIVFGATGNHGGSLAMYPASYNHVIGVAATDTNNERAYFSNYGSSADLSAPGVKIYSTYGSDYGSLQGTSMACPVAAGEAAVILSGQDSLASLAGKSGKARVDAVTNLMRSNTIAAGSGMGKGITSLPKVFKLSTAATKPNAPEITIVPDSTKQSVTVTVQAEEGMKLCYTTNGKNPVWQSDMTDQAESVPSGTDTGQNGTDYDGTIYVGSDRTTFTIDCSGAAKGTVKAIAVNAAGVTGTVMSKSYTLSPYVTEITISGAAKVERGKSIQLTASVSPTFAANKKVTWELQTEQGTPADASKIKISAGGKVTAAQAADLGAYTVIARAQDGGNSTQRYSIQVVEAGTAIRSLAFDKKMTKELWLTQDVPEPTLALTPSLIAEEKNADGTLMQIDSARLGDRVVWTSNKPAVATVDDKGVVTARAAGTATITAKANDSGNKKAAVTITVKQAVTEITITNDKGKTEDHLFTVAAGKSVTLKTVLNPAKPANKKVVWSIDSGTSDVTINKTTGKITVKAGAPAGTYTVTAAAADGKGAAASRSIKVCSGAIGEIRLSKTKTKLYTKYVDDGRTNTETITATIRGANGAADFDPNAYEVTSSKESVVKASATSNADGTVSITLVTTGNMYGKANVIIAATDGSRKKASCAVTVAGGITKAEFQDDSRKKVSSLTLFRAGTNSNVNTATLQVSIGASDGANRSAYEVTSSNPQLVAVETDKEKNQVTLTASGKFTGKAKITLLATDGSKKKAVCTVTVGNPASKINIAPKAGTTAYVAPGRSLQLKATMETEYGAPVSRAVAWSLPAGAEDEGITVNSAGKVSVAGNVTKIGKIKITATAKDGSGVSESYSIIVTTPTTFIKKMGDITGKGIKTLSITSNCTSFISCSSSNPDILSPKITYKPYNPNTKVGGTGTVQFVAAKKGTAIITLKALDSTDHTYKIMIKVN